MIQSLNDSMIQVFISVDRFSTPRVALMQLSRQDAFGPHVWLQRFRDKYAAIGLLVILQNRQPRPANRQTTPVQGVDEFRLALAIRPVANACSARLERLKVGTR